MARPGRSGRKPAGPPWFNAGMLPLLAVAMVLLGLWLAWSVRGGQHEMAGAQLRQQELQLQHQELSQRRDELGARERIETEAAKQGLYPPGKGQVRNL